MRDSLSNLGLRLAEAWKGSGQRVTPTRDELPLDRPEAYFVQDEMAKALNEALSGWKVGATSAKMRELDGHDDVIPGRIFKSVTWIGNEQVLPISRFPGARVETEFAYRLLIDLPVRDQPWSADEIAPHAVLHPAIEIIGIRHAIPEVPASARSLMTIADNGGGIGFVFGDAIKDWRHVDFQQHRIKLIVDSEEPADNFLGDMRCVPIQAVADLANHLNYRGIGLSAGDFISTGAATVPQTIKAGSKVLADFDSLGIIKLKFE